MFVYKNGKNYYCKKKKISEPRIELESCKKKLAKSVRLNYLSYHLNLQFIARNDMLAVPRLVIKSSLRYWDPSFLKIKEGFYLHFILFIYINYLRLSIYRKKVSWKCFIIFVPTVKADRLDDGYVVQRLPQEALKPVSGGYSAERTWRSFAEKLLYFSYTELRLLLSYFMTRTQKRSHQSQPKGQKKKKRIRKKKRNKKWEPRAAEPRRRDINDTKKIWSGRRSLAQLVRRLPTETRQLSGRGFNSRQKIRKIFFGRKSNSWLHFSE